MGERPVMTDVCPLCHFKVVWNGVELVCLACSWTGGKNGAPTEKKKLNALPQKRPGRRAH